MKHSTTRYKECQDHSHLQEEAKTMGQAEYRSTVEQSCPAWRWSASGLAKTTQSSTGKWQYASLSLLCGSMPAQDDFRTVTVCQFNVIFRTVTVCQFKVGLRTVTVCQFKVAFGESDSMSVQV